MDAKQKTFYWERWRAVSTGVIETASFTFLLLIAVRWFNAGALAKSLIAGGASVGLLLSPWILHLVQESGLTASRAAARLAWIGAASFGVMALAPTLAVFTIGSVAALATLGGMAPLATQIYQENYPASERGALFSRTVVIRIAVAAVFAESAGRALSEGRIHHFPLLLGVFAAAFAFAAFCFARCPSSPLKSDKGTHPFRSLRYAQSDALFRRLLICWMIFGVGNLMTLPLRVEYAANPKYGFNLSVSVIAVVTAVVPNLARLVSSRLWGLLFDRINFFTLRAIVNTALASGIVIYFSSSSLSGLILGATVFGMAASGGEVMWSLWVTKFAPPQRAADYMSVHTFFTGIRGLLSPFLGFFLVGLLPMQVLGWISGGMIFASIFLLAGKIREGERALELRSRTAGEC